MNFIVFNLYIIVYALNMTNSLIFEIEIECKDFFNDEHGKIV